MGKTSLLETDRLQVSEGSYRRVIILNCVYARNEESEVEKLGCFNVTLRENRDDESPEYFRRFDDDNVGIYWLLNDLKTQETSFLGYLLH